MDPYIESSRMWGDFHGSMLGAIRAELNARLPEGYAASIELVVWTHEPEPRKRRRPVEPDVYIRETSRRAEAATAVVTATAPRTIVLPRAERKRRKYIKVVDARTRQVVTVVELLSPANKKSGDDRELYLTKRSEYLASRINVVEIDLLRAGKRPPLGEPPPEPAAYYVMVCRSWEFPRAGYWTFGVRDPLPPIPVPITRELPDTILPLRACVDRAYDEGRYGTELAYDEPVKPRLSEADAAWVRQVLAARAKKNR
jgi:hypothetical protein